ncbi:bacterial Ig-like domain-containing protein, partial [Enterocloster bolteae]
GVSKVDVTYAGKTVEIGIEVKADTPVEPETPTVDKVEIKANPAKTEYKEGEKFDPAGLVLTVKYNKGEDKEVAYSDATKADFAFNPSL